MNFARAIWAFTRYILHNATTIAKVAIFKNLRTTII